MGNIKIVSRVSTGRCATSIKAHVARYYATAYDWYAYDAALVQRSVNRKIYFAFMGIYLLKHLHLLTANTLHSLTDTIVSTFHKQNNAASKATLTLDCGETNLTRKLIKRSA